MEKKKMGALLGVAQGSSKEPKLVVIRWNGASKEQKPIAFVGKGITFDTGGVSLNLALAIGKDIEYCAVIDVKSGNILWSKPLKVKSVSDIESYYSPLIPVKEQKTGVIASSMENVAVEIRHLQRTEIAEIAEYFSTGQKGSSAMPLSPFASQIGSGLTGVLYVLDEPSIGLHQCDNDRLIATLKNLRDMGNTVIVVEHDEDTIMNKYFMNFINIKWPAQVSKFADGAINAEVALSETLRKRATSWGVITEVEAYIGMDDPACHAGDFWLIVNPNWYLCICI
ncbi:cytosol aminopeptidase, putative [Brugia malayi]|uniref:Cytosol aminopeptidase, putative n=1 Tax=Brugia malayi TaxID=6279 RepID=A0A4E9FSK2_BRUMA|nr:cytosol aminopeptidase, putative [Brugia malayi]VIP00243.1 cytosol aminopeptidase, putative [Brugia malayi]